ncbi:hypothetical protein RQP46_003847 [Phenoliferia psychrophenolica]
MEIMHYLTLLVVALLPALALASPTRIASLGTTNATGPQVQLTTGTIEGFYNGTMKVFLGIPYAEAPVGSLRFRAPRAAPTHSGVLAAKTWADACLQTPPDFVFQNAAFSEDCLYLNVWSPRKIHGGAFAVGASSEGLYIPYDILQYADELITLWGQSAGAGSIVYHTLFTDLNEQLFRATVLHSGSHVGTSGTGVGFSPVLGGYLSELPSVRFAGTSRAGHFPTLITTVTDEGTTFTTSFTAASLNDGDVLVTENGGFSNGYSVKPSTFTAMNSLYPIDAPDLLAPFDSNVYHVSDLFMLFGQNPSSGDAELDIQLGALSRKMQLALINFVNNLDPQGIFLFKVAQAPPHD